MPTNQPSTSAAHSLTAEEVQTLSTKCIEAKSLAYCPYSLFHVGAAILTHSGAYITGANVENASYPVGTCAERVAMATAVMQGFKMGSFKAIAVATDTIPGGSPCGMCRQFLREFLSLDTPILLFGRDANYVVKTMGELLPLSFGPEALPPRETLAALNRES